MRSRVGDYLLYETIGTGTFGTVRRAIHEATGVHYAIKIMDKAHIRNQELTLNVRREIAIMKALKHPNIVSLHQVLNSKTNLYIVLDLVRGGELFEVIAKQSTRGGLPESNARRYFHHLIDAVDYCHHRGVCHRDLKPENLLVDDHANLKVTDFGLSSMKGANTTTDLLSTQCGTPNYIAPEIISCAHPVYDGQKVDAWACGIILYALLAGYLPFDETDVVHLFDVIQKAHLQFPPWISPAARHLISQLLCVDPHLRASVHSVKRHPWFVVDYVPSVPTRSPDSRHKRRRRRATRSADLPALDAFNLSLTPSPPPVIGPPVARNTNPLSHLSAPLPELQLPQLELPTKSHSLTRNASQIAARAVARARNEMMRSGRTMSFSKKYSLLRKGVVNYGHLEIGVASFLGPQTLGGEEHARMRGILSTCSSSVFQYQTDQDAAIDLNTPMPDQEDTCSSDSTAQVHQYEEKRTMHAIRSLQTVIAVSKSRCQRDQNDSQTPASMRDAQLIESTLNALRRLRRDLQSDTCHPALETGQIGRNCVFPSSPAMPTLQKREMIRLLNVWEARLVSDTSHANSNAADGTTLSEAEVMAFQSLLRKWETFLEGEVLVEDVLIPGSERVDDEAPAFDVPERFMNKHVMLRNMDFRRREGDVVASSPLKQQTPKTLGWSVEGSGTDTNGESKSDFWGDRNSPRKRPSALQSNDLTDMWNHVLVANTSDLGSGGVKVDFDAAIRTPVSTRISMDMEGSPVTDFRSSGDGRKVNFSESSSSHVSEQGANGASSDSRGSGNERFRALRYFSTGANGARRPLRRSLDGAPPSAMDRARLSLDIESSPVTEFRSSRDRRKVNFSESSSSHVSEQGANREEESSDSRGSGYERFSALKYISNRTNKAQRPHRRSVDGAPPSAMGKASLRTLSLGSDVERRKIDAQQRFTRSKGQRRIHSTEITPQEKPSRGRKTKEAGGKRNSIERCSRRSSRRASGWGERRLGQGWQKGHRDRLFSKLRHLQLRSKFEGRFECNLDPRICLKKMEKMLNEMGVDVNKRRGMLVLHVDLREPSGNVAVVGTFNFENRKGGGCVVCFKRKGKERVISRSKEASMLSDFFDHALDWFTSTESNAMVA